MVMEQLGNKWIGHELQFQHKKEATMMKTEWRVSVSLYLATTTTLSIAAPIKSIHKKKDP